ncbi:unnamed protein product [Closterium sp. NIES-53]
MTCATAATAATATTLATAPTAAMASPTVLTFDAEGRAVDFDVWVDDLQLFLQCDSRDGVSLFNHTSGVSTAPAVTADSTVRSQWTTRDAVARLAVRIARYSSPATPTLSRLMLPYLFPDLAAFATVADLVAHLRDSDARYHAALPTDFCAKNPPPMYIALYYLVTRLPDSLASVRDHFLSLCPTKLTVDLLEKRLTAAEKNILAIGASRGDRRTPFFEGCSPVPLLLSVASAAAVDLVGTEEVGAASASSGRRRTSKGKGSKSGGGGGEGSSGGGGGGRGRGSGGGGGTGSGGGCGGDGGRGGGGGGGGGSGSGGGGSGGGGAGRGSAAQRGGFGGSQRQQQQRTRETPSVQQLREWYAGRGRSGGVGPCTYVLCTGTRSGEVCGLPHTTQRCFDFDAALAAMYALADSAEGDCYLSVPPDPTIAAAALCASASTAPGTSASAAPGAGAFALSGTAPTESLHTFTLDSGASRSFFRDSTTLTPLSWPVAVSLADPSGGPVLAHSSTVLLCPAAPSGLLSGLHLPSFSTNLVSGADLQDAWFDQFTPGGQRVTHCTCSRTGRHLATFTRRPGSSLYTLTTAPPPVPASGQVFAAVSRSSPTSAPCSCRPLAHETLLWHHRLGHPSLPRLRGMASRALGHERYFLLVVDDYSRYTTVFPLCSKGEVRERRGVFSDILKAFCRSEGIRQTFTVPASPQQNGIAERRIGMPRVSLPETTPTLRWTGKVGDASTFRIWGSRAFVCVTTADKLSSRAVPCVFLGFPPNAPRWQFYHPTSRRVLSSHDVRFDESVSYYHLFPYCTTSPPPPRRSSWHLPLSPQQLREWYSRRCQGASGATGGTAGASGGAAGAGGATGGAAGGAAGAAGGAARGAAGGGGAAGASGGAAGAGAARGAAGAGGAAGASGGAAGAGAAGGAAGAGGAGGAAGAGAAGGGAGAGAAGGATSAGAAGGAAGTGDPGAEGTGSVSAISGGAVRPRQYYVPTRRRATPLQPK